MAASRQKTLHIATRSGWYRYELQGGAWSETEKALSYFSISCLAIDSQNPNRIIAGTENFGLFVSDNRGDDWRRPEVNIPSLSTWAMLSLNDGLLVGTRPAALFRSNGTGGWQEVPELRRGALSGTFPPNPDEAPRTRYLAVDPQTPNKLYAGIEVGGMMVSENSGLNWRAANDGLTDLDVHQIQPSAKHDGVVVLACGEACFRGVDDGAHWQDISPKGHRTYGTAVTEDCDGNFYLGITDGRPRTWIRKARADGAIFASSDSGKSWDLAAEGLRGAPLELIPGIDGRGALVGTSEGEVLSVDASGCRTILRGLPAINGMVLVGRE